MKKLKLLQTGFFASPLLVPVVFFCRLWKYNRKGFWLTILIIVQLCILSMQLLLIRMQLINLLSR